MGAKTVPANVETLDTMMLVQSILDCPTIRETYIKARNNGWQIFAVRQSRGRCYFDKKWITIPQWVLHSNQPGQWIYYVAHEYAHYLAGWAAQHGPEFMEQLKLLCPLEYQHYELGYKERNASAAGITREHADKAKHVSWKQDLMDLL